MSASPVLYETHSHTPLCKHAVGEPEEYAASAFDKGLGGLMVTCHNPMPRGFSSNVRMREQEFETYLSMVERARVAWSGRVDVRLGIECDYFPGYEDWLEAQVSNTGFSYVIGSVHPQLPEYRELYWSGDPIDYQKTYFASLAGAAETGFFDSLAHPDLVKNETAGAWNPEHIETDILRSLDRIARTGIAMELNTSGVNKVVAEMNPFPTMLRQMRERSIPVVVGSDAHEPGRVGDRFAEALDLLEECGYEAVSYFLDRERRELSIADARASLQRDSG